jgi:hypothetical protein
MKKSKVLKAFSLFLVLLLIMAQLVGCGGSKTDSGTKSEVNTSAAMDAASANYAPNQVSGTLSKPMSGNGNMTLSKEVNTEQYDTISENKFIEAAKTYEQLTTVLEMLFLETNEQGKKQLLSKRISVFLENNDTDILSLYSIICNSYRLRSESLHEGKYFNINDIQVDELSNITRKSIRKYMEFADIQLSTNPNTTFLDIKLTMINNLKQIVAQKNSISLFPR